MRRVRFAAAGLLLAAWIAPAAGQATAPALCEATPLAEIMFNPDGDPAARRARLEKIQSDLAGASAHEKHLLGTFLRMGKAHPAGLVAETDTGMARRLLAHAALDGNLTAMAASAELELAAGEPMAAMVWAQLYAHYSNRLHPDRYRTYQADLINRGFKDLPSGSGTSEEIESSVAGFVAQHGERIEKGLETVYEAAPSGTRDCTPVHAVYSTRLASDGRRIPLRGGRGMAATLRAPTYDPGLALYWVRVAPSGEVAEAFIVDSLPKAGFGKLMLPTVRALRFNAVAADAPMRDVLLPMSLDDGSVRFKD